MKKVTSRVEDEVYGELVKRAEAEGRSLSNYVARVLGEVVGKKHSGSEDLKASKVVDKVSRPAGNGSSAYVR